MADEDIPVEDTTQHPQAAAGKIPRKDQLPMIPMDISDWWDDRPSRYDAGKGDGSTIPALTKKQARIDIIESCKRGKVPPPTKAEMEETLSRWEE